MGAMNDRCEKCLRYEFHGRFCEAAVKYIYQPLGAYSRIDFERICDHGVSVSMCREGCKP